MQCILLADPHPSARWALVTLLREQSGIERIGEAADAENLLALCAEIKPDLVLLDKDLPGMPIEDLIAALHMSDPKPVVIAMSSDPDDGRRLLRAGADAFVSKGEQAAWLLSTLEKYLKKTKPEKGSPPKTPESNVNT